jgi:DNA-binding transcriptional MerR regulator
MTIDEVARATGTTTRNVRAYQERGLVPRPERVGRVGYYSDEHVQRLELITRLLDRGFTLGSIRQLLEAFHHGDGLADVLGLPESASTASRAVVASDVASAELTAELPGLLDLGDRLREAGIPVEAMLDGVGALRADTEHIAERFLDLFLDHIWRPFLDDGAPRERVAAIRSAIELTEPIPADAVGMLVADAMRRRMDAIRDELTAAGDRAECAQEVAAS